MRKPPESIGTQSASRALVLLRHIGARHVHGVRLTDLIALTGMDKSTAHRLLVCLMDEGFVERVPGTKSYRLGIESAQLGLVLPDMAPLVDRFRSVMLKIARISEESVFLMVRSGHHALCVHKACGARSPSISVVEPGTRRVLGISAAGVCMLALASDDELAASYHENAQFHERMGASFPLIRSLVDATRHKGFSEMTAFGPMGLSGVGCAFPVSDTTRVGISIAGSTVRMGPQRRQDLGLLLRTELQALA